MKEYKTSRFAPTIVVCTMAVLAPGCGPYSEAVLMNLWYGLPGLVAGGFQGVQQWISGALSNAFFNLL